MRCGWSGSIDCELQCLLSLERRGSPDTCVGEYRERLSGGTSSDTPGGEVPVSRARVVAVLNEMVDSRMKWYEIADEGFG